ncbi:MAG TPA: tetratricopeptide repeat protein [Bryobacteraceae bacterium]|nr:tetratricopeptide repeat protein [Bryobacteraceae bacterium]
MSQKLFDEADRLEDAGETERALDTWRQLAVSSPTRNVFLRLGGCAKGLGKIEEAEAAFQRALVIGDRSGLALMALGIIALNRGDYETGEGYLRRSCAAGEDPARFTLFGVALRNLGRRPEAEAAYREAIRLDPNYEEAYFNLGVVLRKDRPSEAQALFRKALELDPDFASAHRELGFLLSKRGDVSNAERHLRKSIELQPNDCRAHIYLGTHLWSADTGSAIAEFRCAQQIQPDWTVPLWSLGNIHELVLKDFDSAQAFFESALRLDPDESVILTSFGRLCKKRGAFDLAKHYLGRALHLDPENQKARELLADMASGGVERAD